MSLPHTFLAVRFRTAASALLHSRHGGVFLFLGVFVLTSTLLRLGLLFRLGSEVAWDLGLCAALAWGLLFDLGMGLLVSIPLTLILTLLPAGWGSRAWQRGVMITGGLSLWAFVAFCAIAEWTFWEEFSARFNFIAVDYLVYTTEVLGNIRESYDLPLVFAAMGGFALAITLFLHTLGLTPRYLASLPDPAARRWQRGAAWLLIGLLPAFLLNQDQIPEFRDNYQHELAKNGLWSFFHAFRNNELDYDKFYRTRPTEQVFNLLRKELIEDGSVLLRPRAQDSLRYVGSTGREQHPNIIQITVESLSAEFLGTFSPVYQLTPELDAIAAKSLVFENFYATGSRTVRGIEALSLSLPPTPGHSIVKREQNSGMFTLGSVLRSRGYDTAFLYGGYGYFDNMNGFFGGNGYRTIDHSSVKNEDVTFANAWGACDEDLFRWTLREADSANASGKPFHYFLMTTSNHRPYTYPEGRIDLPPKVSGRAGAVKYTDYAIGKFLRDASGKPWFRDTVFVIVADHTASSAGKAEISVEKHHIPLIIYAPGGHIAPGRVKALTSQIDYAPTLLGLLNWSYASRFFGHDVLRTDPQDQHVLLGNYQKLGHIEDGRLTILSPRQGVASYAVDSASGALTPLAHSEDDEEKAIGFYAGASYLYKHRLYQDLAPREMRRQMRLGRALAQRTRRTAHAGPVPTFSRH